MYIRNLLREIKQKENYKNTLILFSGSSIAQALPLLATIVLTRIFTKEQFGEFFIYSALCMILSTFITLRLELSIILPSERNDGKILLLSSLITSATLSFLIFIAIYLFYNPITILLGEKNIGKLLLILPISLFLLGIAQSCSYWFNRNNNYTTISIAKIIKTITSSFFQIGLGFLAYLKYGLVIGLISGQLASAIYSMILTLKDKIFEKKNFTLKKMYNLISTYKDIPIFNTSIAVSNTISNQLPIFLLTSFYSLEMTAFYGLANRIIATPMGLISQSVGQVLFSEASRKFNNGQNLRSLVLSTYKKLIQLAAIPFLILLISAPYLFSFLFGSEWKLAGTFTQFLIPWLFLMFLNSPMSYIIIILKKQKELLIYDVLLLVFRFIALFVGYYFFKSAMYSIIFYAIVGALFNLFLLFFIIRISNLTNIETS